jgi:hypothetical protein
MVVVSNLYSDAASCCVSLPTTKIVMQRIYLVFKKILILQVGLSGIAC